MVEKVQMALMFLGTLVGLSVTYLAVLASCARALRLGVVSYVLGSGPVVMQAGPFKLRLLPFRAVVEPASRNAILPPPPSLAAALERGDLRYFDDLPFAVSLGFGFLSAILALLATAVFLGIGQAAHFTVEGVRDYVQGVFGPLSETPRLLDDAFRVYRRSSSPSAVGHALAIGTAINVLWLPNTVMAVLAMSSRESRGWAKVRLLAWLLWRVTELIWFGAFILWLTRA
jgi:hypothetical protein